MPIEILPAVKAEGPEDHQNETKDKMAANDRKLYIAIHK